MNRRRMITALAAAVLCPAGAHAQAYPNRPIRLVVPSAAGDAADLAARILAAKMSAELGVQVVLDVKAGAGGLAAVEIAARSAPDGYTMCLASAAALSAIPFMVPRMTFDWQSDLALLTNVVRVPAVMVVAPALGVNTLPEFAAYARANPGGVRFGSAGTGSISHLASELLKAEARIDMAHVPYGSIAAAVADLGGRIQFLTGEVSMLLPHIRSGTAKPLAVTSRVRVGALPNVPTTRDAGYPRVTSENWYGLVAPYRAPVFALDKLRNAALDVLQSADVKRQFEANNAVASPTSPAELAAFIRSEQAKWGSVIARAGIRLE
jgi:tripartite-type tricarboxylate transporter receptor subunit TctC